METLCWQRSPLPMGAGKVFPSGMMPGNRQHRVPVPSSDPMGEAMQHRLLAGSIWEQSEEVTSCWKLHTVPFIPLPNWREPSCTGLGSQPPALNHCCKRLPGASVAPVWSQWGQGLKNPLFPHIWSTWHKYISALSAPQPFSGHDASKARCFCSSPSAAASRFHSCRC